MLPLRVSDLSVGADAEQPVGVGDGVQVGLLAVDEERVRLPDLIEHRDARPQLRYVGDV